MTRNDAYKHARMVWRARAKRGRVGFGHCWQTIAWGLAAAGHNASDIALVRVWLKAFYSGRRLPDVADLIRAEKIR